MKKYTIGITILLLCIFLIVGCSNSRETSKPEKSFLWEVSSDTTTVYILGSIRLANTDLYPLVDAIDDAYDMSENLAVEVDITSINEMETAALLMEKGMYLGGETLRDKIPEDLYDNIYDMLEDLGMSKLELSYTKRFEPWVVVMQLEVLQFKKYGFTEDYGIDKHFLNRAHEEGKAIFELETAEFQISLFDGFSENVQISLLEDAIEDAPTKKEIEHLFEVWENGDVVGMEKLTLEDTADNPELSIVNEKLIDERNFGMVEKIEGFLQDDEIYFVVVGAGHLVGDNGIINILTEKGYITTQQ